MSEEKRFSNEEEKEDSNFECVIREAYGEILVNISSIRDTMKRRTSKGEKNNKKENISLLPKDENQALPVDRPEEGWKFVADTETKTETKEGHELGPKKYSTASRLQSFDDSSTFSQNAISRKTSWTDEMKDDTGKDAEKRSKKSSHSKHERAIRKALAQMRMQDFNSETDGGNALSDGGTEKLICKTVRIKNDILYVVKGDV